MDSKEGDERLFYNIVKELWFQDTDGFSDMFRLNYAAFQEVLRYIEPEIITNQVMGGHMVGY